MELRKLYQPIQLYPHPSGEEISYREFLPAPQLQPYVYCYWKMKSIRPLAPDYYYQVVADGCMDLLLEVGNPEQNFVIGFTGTHSQFPLGSTFHYLGIRFFPATFPLLFRISAAELKNQAPPLGAVFPRMSQLLAEAIGQERDLTKMVERLDRMLLSLATPSTALPDPRLFQAVQQILHAKGNLNIQDLDTSLSPRQIRRLFQHYLGGTAKQFAMIVRFQHVIQNLSQAPSFGFHHLPFEAGYTDQAHFCREFKTFSGSSPGQVYPA